MKTSLIRFLILQNWRIYGRIKGSLGKNHKLTFFRIYLILPAVFLLAYMAYRFQGLVSIWLIFMMVLFFLELGKVINKCSFDPIHFFI